MKRPRARRGETRARALVVRGWQAHPLMLLVCGALAVAALSLLAPASPGYDPWAWIVWGREVAHLELSTEKGPSFKPLPVAFTTLFSLFGGAAPALWLVLARAGGIVTVVAAFRVAARLARSAKLFAGLVAAAGVLLVDRFLGNVAGGWSEFLVAALLLVAVERHLDGARRAAFVLVFAAGLIRPEAWPALALYGIYLWRSDRRNGVLVALLLALVPLLWYGPDYLISGNPLRSQRRAQQPLPGRPGLAEHPALEVVRQGSTLVLVPVQLLAAGASIAAFAAFLRRRRQMATTVLALGAVGWVATVAIMAQVGYTGNPRYLLPATAFVCVLGGIGAAGFVEVAGLAAGRFWRRAGAARRASVAAGAVLLAASVPAVVSAGKRIRADVDDVRARNDLYAELDDAVARAGGRRRVLACGDVFTGAPQFPMLAWTLEIPLRELAIEPAPPGVVFRARPESPASADDEPVPGRPFRLVARTPRWEVFSACRLRRARRSVAAPTASGTGSCRGRSGRRTSERCRSPRGAGPPRA